jgi:phytoene desaturase
MNEQKKVLIIGAGVGGIATAIGLARNGYQVKVFEKNVNPGGRCGQILHEGHRFDLGATIFLMPSIYREVFDYLGLSLEDVLPSKPLPTIYKIHYPDGKTLDFTTDKNYLESQLEVFEKGSSMQAKKFVAKGYELFQLAYKHLLGRNFYSWSEFITLSNLALLFRIKTHIKHQTYVSRFFKDPHLKMAFSFQNIYVGQNPLTAPALFAMLPAAELTEGSIFPIGGMYSIVEKLLETARGLGVEIQCNKPVVQILTEGRKATGIRFEDGSEMQGDLIVANADLPYVYRELLPDRRKSNHLDKLKYSCSAIVFHWGMDKRYPELGHHGVFLSEDYQESLNEIFRNNALGENPSFYVHAPGTTDPTAAPDNQDSISIIVPVGHIDPKMELDWNILKQTARASVIRRLKKMGLSDIDEHIKFEMCCLPKNWESSFHVSKGSVFGSVNHSIFQMGYFRPHNKHDRYKNLYFAGGSTHPGNGVPLVLLSAKLTSERILKEAASIPVKS